MGMTPEELWKEAVRGSQPSWNKLYALFGPRLYQFFLKNLSNAEKALDKTQEVFERLFKHKEAFQTGFLKTWIFRIARNLLIDEWRRRGRAEILAEDPPEVADPKVRVEEEVIERLTRDDLVRQIDAILPVLSEEDRMVIGLVYLGGLSIPELAQVMEIPLGTAKTRTRQARLRLDRQLAEHIHEQESKAHS